MSSPLPQQCIVCELKKPLVACQPCGHSEQCKKCLNKILHSKGEGCPTCPTCKQLLQKPLTKKQKKDEIMRLMTERQLNLVREQLDKGVQFVKLDESPVLEVDTLVKSYGYEDGGFVYDNLSNPSYAWKFDILNTSSTLSKECGSNSTTLTFTVESMLWACCMAFMFGIFFIGFMLLPAKK